MSHKGLYTPMFSEPESCRYISIYYDAAYRENLHVIHRLHLE